MVPDLIFYGILFIVSIFLLVSLSKFERNKNLRRPPLLPSPLGFPIIGHLHLLGPLLHQALHKLASRHGPLMYIRLGSVHSVVVSNPETAKEFLRTHDLNFSYRIFNQAIDYLTYNAATPLAPYGPLWIFIKKLSISELLGSHTMNKYLPLRTMELHRFLRLLFEKSKRGESVNLSKEILRLNNNIIYQMILSVRLSAAESEEAVELVREVTSAFGEFNVSDFIWFCKKWDLQGFGKRLEGIRRRYNTLIERIIGDREEMRKNGEKRDVKDFLDILLDAFEDKNSEVQLSRDIIKGLVMDYLTAGTDSTAVAIEWAMAEIINHPPVLNKARKEIEEVVGENRLVEESDLPNLPYIQAIIKETFRLHPPIPVILRSSEKECIVKDYTIPKGTLLIVNLWSIGKDPENWENPLEFNPDRFLNTNFDFRGQHYQLLPFGTGRRNCTGMALAMQILPVTLAVLIQCFDWKVVNGGKGSNGDDNLVDLSEKPGITAPLAHELVCVPIAHFSSDNILFTDK